MRDGFTPEQLKAPVRLEILCEFADQMFELCGKLRDRVKALEAGGASSGLAGTHLNALADGIVDGISGPIGEELKAIAARVLALEERPASLKYTGVWSKERAYEIDEACTHDGGLWIARDKSKGIRPGDGLKWQLSVKRGAPGRDGRDAA